MTPSLSLPKVRTYVNGTLYSILTVPSLKEEALALGMESSLNYLISHSEPNFQQQLQFILGQLLNGKSAPLLSSTDLS
jgi:hypothetical protein